MYIRRETPQIWRVLWSKIHKLGLNMYLYVHDMKIEREDATRDSNRKGLHRISFPLPLSFYTQVYERIVRLNRTLQLFDLTGQFFKNQL